MWVQVTMMIGLKIKDVMTDGCCPDVDVADADVSLVMSCRGCCIGNITAIFTGVPSLLFLLYDEGSPFRTTQVLTTSLHPPLPLQPRNCFAPYPI